MPSKIFRYTKHKKRQYFPMETIIDELLHEILEHVHERKDLTALCLVSRRLYVFTIGHLYRDICFDPAAASHRVLLRRLTHEKSSLVQRIRILRLNTKWIVHDEYYRQLRHLITRMKNPIKFVINVPLSGPLGAADIFLYTLHSRFPKASIEIKQGPQSTGTIKDTIRTLCAHPACEQITRLDIDLEPIGRLWETCKRDLVVIIRSAQGLERLHIGTASWMSFPEYLAVFQNYDFPKLKWLDLGCARNAIFSTQELARWGNRSGWKRLHILSTGSLGCFSYFVGHQVGLDALQLYTHHDNDFDEIEQILASANTSTPFPNLYTFYCIEKGVWRRQGLPFMPVSILRWMPKLQSLLLVRDWNQWDPVAEPYLPSPQHIRDIRQHCPDIKFLTTELGLTSGWPTELIKELSRFEQLITLQLFVCFDQARRTGTRYIDYRRIARQMYHERKRLGLLWEIPFHVQLNTVYNQNWIFWEKTNHAEIWFGSKKTLFGDFTFPSFSLDQNLMNRRRGRLDKMTLEDLEAKQNKTVFEKNVGKHKGIVKEIERRKRDEGTKWGPDDYPTLYDKTVKREG